MHDAGPGEVRVFYDGQENWRSGETLRTARRRAQGKGIEEPGGLLRGDPVFLLGADGQPTGEIGYLTSISTSPFASGCNVFCPDSGNHPFLHDDQIAPLPWNDDIERRTSRVAIWWPRHPPETTKAGPYCVVCSIVKFDHYQRRDVTNLLQNEFVRGVDSGECFFDGEHSLELVKQWDETDGKLWCRMCRRVLVLSPV
jgi:hypothetical protein